MPNWRSLVVIVVLGLAGSASAQRQFGEYTHATLTGNVGTGYAGSFGETAESSTHNTSVTGEGFLNAYYYSPNLLNINVHPYYGRSQDSQSSVTIGSNRGVGTTVNMFSGTHFPGSFTYSKSEDDTGQYSIPGSSALVTRSNSSEYGIGWSANLPGLPHVSAQYTSGNSNGGIVGIAGKNVSDTRNFSLTSSYNLRGWPLNATYLHLKNSSDAAATLTGTATTNNGTSSILIVSTSHSLNVMGGNLSLNYSRSSNDYVSKTSGTNGSVDSSSGTANSANANVSFLPVRAVNANAQFSYSDNLLGSVVQQAITDGGAPVVSGNGPLRNLEFSGSMNWSGPHNILIGGGAIRQQQYYQGTEYDNTVAYGNLNYGYSRPLLGSLLFNFTFSDAANQNGNSGAGFWGNVNFTRQMKRFDVSASLGYSQSVQTIASFITTSGTDYSVSASRKVFKGIRWRAGFGGSHSVLSSNAGDSNHMERFNTGFSRRRLAASLFYGQSHQRALITSTGLVPTTLPPSILGANNLTMYDSKNYGVSGSLELIRSMTLMLSYSKSRGDSLQPNSSVQNNSTVEYMLLRYPYRKLYFSAGYNRVQQGIVSAGNPIHPVTSYNFGISRWIKAF